MSNEIYTKTSTWSSKIIDVIVCKICGSDIIVFCNDDPTVKVGHSVLVNYRGEIVLCETMCKINTRQSNLEKIMHCFGVYPGEVRFAMDGSHCLMHENIHNIEHKFDMDAIFN